jgi:hypothetical protein
MAEAADDPGQAEILLVPCPFPDRSSPHGAAAADYVRQVAAEVGLTGSAAAKVLHGMALGEAAALTYPDADPERLRVAALWIAFLVLFDDAWSDLLSLDGDWRSQVLTQHCLIRDVIHGCPAVALEGHPLALLLHRFLADIAQLDPAWDRSRLGREISRYLSATQWELDLRSRGKVPDFTSYLRMRRVFSTMTVQVELDYFVCRLTLPEQIRAHPCVQLADAAVADYGCIANDLYSLQEEKQQGQISNVVTVLQHEHGWSADQAIAYAQRLCAQALAVYDDIRSRPASYGLGDDKELRCYFDHYEAFMSAAARWPARSARYRKQAASSALSDPLSSPHPT